MALPTRPVQDAIIDPVWGQWVHDNINGPLVKVKRTNTQLAATGLATLVTWETEDYDPYNFHVAAAAALVIPAGGAGIYNVSLIIRWGSGGGSNRLIDVQKNAAAYVQPVAASQPPTAGGTATYQTLSMDLPLIVGDSITVRVTQDSGADLTFTGHMSMHRIRNEIPTP